MTEMNLDELTDEELLIEAKKMKLTNVVNALLIGFLVGVLLFSIFKNSIGLFSLIPLYFVYKLVNRKNNHDELKRLLKERGIS